MISQHSQKVAKYRVNSRHFKDHDGTDTTVKTFDARLARSDVNIAWNKMHANGRVLKSVSTVNLETTAR